MLEVIEQQAQQVGAAGGLVFAPDPQVTIAPIPSISQGNASGEQNSIAEWGVRRWCRPSQALASKSASNGS